MTIKKCNLPDYSICVSLTHKESIYRDEFVIHYYNNGKTLYFTGNREQMEIKYRELISTVF